MNRPSTSNSSTSDSSSSSSSSSDSSSSSSYIDSHQVINEQNYENAEINYTNDESTEINSNAELQILRKGKKRKVNSNQWSIKQAKINRNTGLSYTSASKSKKKYVERKLRPPCGNQCKQKCNSKIDETQRQNIFEKYWSLGDLSKQRSYIATCMLSIKPKYRYSSTENHRKLNNAYYFELNETRFRVCKHFFKATLDLNDRPIRTVISKKGIPTSLQTELRGKHMKHRKISDELKTDVRKHIDSIPRIESHYLRAQTTREYIAGGYSLSSLWRDYRDDCVTAGRPHVNLQMYSKIFNEEYNISFFTPKKDQCELCTSFQNAVGEDKEKFREKYEIHQREKELSRKEKDEDKKKSNKNFIVSVYDLQAVLPAPRGDVSVFYYKSKLNSFNFTISELNTGQTECYFCHEGEGNRGVEEIASCVLMYLQNIIKDREDNGCTDLLDFVFYSDNCCGQQKNKYMIALYLYTIMKFPIINSITHKYLITGHTQNEGDCVHSTIEKQVKNSLKFGPIYVPSQYAQLIRMAKKRGKPYNVNELTHLDFSAIKALVDDVKLNFSQVKIYPVKVWKIEKDSIHTFYFKNSYSEEFQTVKLNRKSKGNSTIQPLADLKHAYRVPLKIKENKKTDLLTLIKNNHIPQFYANFYNTLK